MLSIQNLADRIRPENAILLLGAGALWNRALRVVHHWPEGLASELNPPPDGNDLADTTT